MKSVFVVFMLMSLSAFSQLNDVMTEKEEQKYVAEVAKELRKNLYKEGHQYVYSHILNVTSENTLEDLLKGPIEQKIKKEEYSQLVDCLNETYCSLYQVKISSEYWGGYGEDGHFVRLNTKKRVHGLTSYTIYTE